ncbi:hypothetical protein BJ546DRAFT_60246 [Cryomyces antarcticus]
MYPAEQSTSKLQCFAGFQRASRSTRRNHARACSEVYELSHRGQQALRLHGDVSSRSGSLLSMIEYSRSMSPSVVVGGVDLRVDRCCSPRTTGTGTPRDNCAQRCCGSLILWRRRPVHLSHPLCESSMSHRISNLSSAQSGSHNALAKASATGIVTFVVLSRSATSIISSFIEWKSRSMSADIHRLRQLACFVGVRHVPPLFSGRRKRFLRMYFVRFICRPKPVVVSVTTLQWDRGPETKTSL